jgi:hypothetical protein
MQTNKLGKAMEVFDGLLNRTTDEEQRATYYISMGSVYSKMGECANALFHYDRVLKILKLPLGDGHPLTKSVVKSIELVKKKLLFVDYRLILPE